MPAEIPTEDRKRPSSRRGLLRARQLRAPKPWREDRPARCSRRSTAFQRAFRGCRRPRSRSGSRSRQPRASRHRRLRWNVAPASRFAPRRHRRLKSSCDRHRSGLVDTSSTRSGRHHVLSDPSRGAGDGECRMACAAHTDSIRLPTPQDAVRTSSTSRPGATRRASPRGGLLALDVSVSSGTAHDPAGKMDPSEQTTSAVISGSASTSGRRSAPGGGDRLTLTGDCPLAVRGALRRRHRVRLTCGRIETRGIRLPTGGCCASVRRCRASPEVCLGLQLHEEPPL